MTKVFVAGPIDFHDLADLVDYRLRFREQLRDAQYEPVDQYSEALEAVAEHPDAAEGVKTTLESIGELPDEPYVAAVANAIAERSLGAVLEDPDLVPELASERIVGEIVDRDLELLRSCDEMLAYFPTPSCGTTVELLHAVEHDIPCHVVSDSPSMFIQHYADTVSETVGGAIEQLSAPEGSRAGPTL